jgi:hypothetical protein
MVSVLEKQLIAHGWWLVANSVAVNYPLPAISYQPPAVLGARLKSLEDAF